jgi:hypothetical protein
MSDWRIRLPVRDRDTPVHEIGFDAWHLEGEDGAIVRELVLDAVINTDIKTTGQLLDALERMSESQRRALLDKTRLSIGLQSTADVEAHEKFVAANRALRPPPPQRCAVCNALPLTAEGYPDLNVRRVRRWHCERHLGEAQPGDMDPPQPPLGRHFQEFDPDEIARVEAEDARRDAELAERDRQRREERELWRLEAEAVAERRAEQERRELFGGMA